MDDRNDCVSCGCLFYVPGAGCSCPLMELDFACPLLLYDGDFDVDGGDVDDC